MEKRRRSEAFNGEILLPGAIIQHIQSFLSRKQAAQTSIVSKSWYCAWSTRPNLDLDERDVKYLGYAKSEIVRRLWKSTVRRYEKSNLKIESLRLCANDSNLTTELIAKAMKMGCTGLHFELLGGPSRTFVLPHEVLGSELLIKLSLIRCNFGKAMVNCSKLKSLSLHRVYIEGDIIWDIISSCPLIEELVLSECSCLFETTRRMFALSPFIEFGKQNCVGSGSDFPTFLHEFHKLKCLFLKNVEIHTLFFLDFSSRFPCLKDLTLHHCFGYKGIQISSPSIECISFSHNKMVTFNFDVPSIRKFSFSSSSLPSLSFKAGSRDWDSDISITCSAKRIRLSSSWFLKLKKLLMELSTSKISLYLNISTIFENSSTRYTGDIQGLTKARVENLMMSVDVPYPSAFLEGLFQICRPNFITQSWLPKSFTAEIKIKSNFLELLCKTLIEELSENCSIYQNTAILHDLEEVNVEFFENLASLQPLSWKTLVDASENIENNQKIRFHLKWVL